MKLVNRSALSVRPTQAFVDWINSLEATEGEDDLTLEDVEQESTIYLIPEMDTREALLAWMGEHCIDILENELLAWEEDRAQWPEPVDESLFEQFLRIEYSYMALDLEEEDALESTELDDDQLDSDEV